MRNKKRVTNKELSLEEIKHVELELLLQFDSLCRNEGLRYSLGGGTLLGAIRHKGFIPWDDDVDVMMPRPDYDKFISYCTNNTLPFELYAYETKDDYIFLDAKIASPKTIIIDQTLGTGESGLGIHIDVFPIDGLGNTESEAVSQFMKTCFLRETLNAKTWKRYTYSKTHAWYIEPVRFCLFVLSRFKNAKRMLYKVDKINRSQNFDSVSYSGCVSGAYRLKEIMETETFQSYIEVEFENKKFKAIKNHDAYLKKHYGDYMKLPPVEKRVSHHTFDAYWVED